MVWISRVLKSITHWLDTRFPEKVPAEQFYRMISVMENSLVRLEKKTDEIDNRVRVLEKTLAEQGMEVTLLKDEMNKAKTFIGIKSRVMQSNPIEPRPYQPF